MRQNTKMCEIELVAGNRPPEACGVGDYTNRLWIELSALVQTHCQINRLNGIAAVLRGWLGYSGRTIILQYPCKGYARSLFPLLYLVGKRGIIVTFHEFRRVHPLRKLTIVFMGAFAEKVVFTTSEDRDGYNRWGALRDRSYEVIGIGSNIPKARSIGQPRRRRVVYFGLIQKSKGIEQFIELFELSRRKMGLRCPEFALVGKVPFDNAAYGDRIVADCLAKGVTVCLDLPPEKVADYLAESMWAYLPYIGGVSVRNGAFLACSVNGVRCLVDYPSRAQRYLNYKIRTPGDAFSILESEVALLDRNAPLPNCDTCPVADWREIAASYVRVVADETHPVVI